MMMIHKCDTNVFEFHVSFIRTQTRGGTVLTCYTASYTGAP